MYGPWPRTPPNPLVRVVVVVVAVLVIVVVVVVVGAVVGVVGVVIGTVGVAVGWTASTHMSILTHSYNSFRNYAYCRHNLFT